jgi:hypothetical protein
MTPSWKDARPSKTIEYIAGLWIKTSDYQLGETFELCEIDGIDCIDSLAECVEIIANSQSVIVRGTLTNHGKAISREHGIGNRRMGLDSPCLMETPQRWVMVDIDKWRIPPQFSLDIDDHEPMVDCLIKSVLTVEFHDVRCFYQFSNQCGTSSPGDNLKIHLFFWLSRPVSNVDLRAIFKAHMPGVDRKVFSGNQPHFIANPVLKGRNDPLPARFGWRDSIHEEVVLPAAPPPPVYVAPIGGMGTGGASGQNWLATRLAAMGDGAGLDGFYGVIRGTLWDYAFRVLRGGIPRDDEHLIDLISKAIRAAPKADTRDMNTVENVYLDRAWLRGLIADAIRKRIATKPESPQEIKTRLLRERLKQLKDNSKVKQNV